MRICSWLLFGCLIGLVGCAAAQGPTKRVVGKSTAKIFHEAAEADANRAEKQPGGGEAPAGPARKIIYTADITLVVEDLAATEQSIRQLTRENGGFVAKSETFGRTGTQRSGTWTVRIPVAHFEDFLTKVRDLGVPDRNTTDSRDVTEEFYDLQARIKNKKVEEDRLLKHLEKSTGKLEDILAVERELSRVRGEIEQMEGKVKVLSDLSELTTVTIQAREESNYVPPQDRGFGHTVSSTFFSSVDALVAFGKGLLLVVVAMAPWLPLIAVLGGALWLLVRRISPRMPPPLPTLTALPAEPQGPGEGST